MCTLVTLFSFEVVFNKSFVQVIPAVWTCEQQQSHICCTASALQIDHPHCVLKALHCESLFLSQLYQNLISCKYLSLDSCLPCFILWVMLCSARPVLDNFSQQPFTNLSLCCFPQLDLFLGSSHHLSFFIFCQYFLWWKKCCSSLETTHSAASSSASPLFHPISPSSGKKPAMN